MPSHMGVQKFATSRNAQVETFIDLVLNQYAENLVQSKRISSYELTGQRHFESDIASDVWDHSLVFFDPILKKNVEIWCQTTCYKGNKTGKPEPNKTYEVRETLVEALSVRKLAENPDILFRTAHFTVGCKKYTYEWFQAAKEFTFDLSLYVDDTNEDIFDMIACLFDGASAEFQVRKNFSEAYCSDSSLGKHIKRLIQNLEDWHLSRGLPVQEFADSQYEAIKIEQSNRTSEIESTIARSKNAGNDIKKRCNDLVHGAEETDDLIISTTNLLLDKNPFIKSANGIIKNWTDYVEHLNDNSKDFDDLQSFMEYLWSKDKAHVLINRRLLLRVGSDEAINYIQDLDIPGVTEHNLYKGQHSPELTRKIIIHIIEKHSNLTKDGIVELLTSNKAKNLLRSSIWFEARNGTDLKPSFDYIELALKKAGYKITKASTGNNKPIGYHSQLVTSGERVNAYTNLKLVCSQSNEILAYLKGKYFRPQEFPRRCKEEAYVALTLTNEIMQNKLSKRTDIPAIMFVDMPRDYSPPEYALRRLMCFGWYVAFSVEDVIKILKEINGK